MSFIHRLLGRDGTSQAAVDSVYFALNASLRPALSTVGHYSVSHRFVLANTQAANSRLFTLRNIGANFIMPLRLRINWLQTGVHTAAIEDSIDCYTASGFSVQDTTNTVTPSALRRKSTMTAAPGNVELRGVTIAGAAAGMTGGTVNKAGSAWGQMPKWLLAAQPTAGPVDPQVAEFLSGNSSLMHPLMWANNEGLWVENRVLLGAAAASSVYVELDYAEVAFPF